MDEWVSRQQFGERVAQNTPIQGTAADMMKKAMIDVHSGLEELGTSTRILLQVHDELLLEVPDAEVDDVRELVVDRMERAERAGETGARIIVPTGAIIGLDTVRAMAVGQIESVTLETRKPRTSGTSGTSKL